MKVQLLFVLSLLVSWYAPAQPVISGRVQDSLTAQPVPYATIGIAGSSRGTVTNEQGSFFLQADSGLVQLHIFCIGYAPQTVYAAANSELHIRLRPLSYSLQDVVVDAQEADRIFKKAYEKLKQQKQEVYRSRSFFRLLTRNDDTYTELIENFYDTWLGKTGIRHWELEHGRYALAKDYREKNYIVSADFSLLTRYLDITNDISVSDVHYLPFALDRKYFRHLIFSISGRYEEQGREIVKIDFIPKGTQQLKDAWSGSIYIDSKNFDIYRLTQHWNSWNDPPVFISNPGSRLGDFRMSFDIRFVPSRDRQRMLINHVRMNIDYDLLNRSTGQAVHKVHTYADLLFYDHGQVPQPLNKIPEDDYATDYDRVQQCLYVKQFWDHHPILAETPLERRVRQDFERAGSFGKAFHDANDTLEFIKDGYLIWNSDHALRLKDIPASQPSALRTDKFELVKDGEALGGLYSELYFAWNCYNDSFYCVVLPLLDAKATWMSDSIRPSPYAEYLYQRYFDLLEVYKRRFVAQLRALPHPCSSRKEIARLYEAINKEFHDESLKMVNDCWGMGQYHAWGNKIDAWLEEPAVSR